MIKGRLPVVCLFSFLLGTTIQAKNHDSPMEKLGDLLFNDTNLSQPVGQACVSCHDPRSSYTDPAHGANSQGASKNNFGTRNAPTLTYLKFSKPLVVAGENTEGGLFWDGRANSLEEQATMPFLNPIEMGATKEYVVNAVCSSENYGALFRNLFGESACDETFMKGFPAAFKVLNQVEKAFEGIGLAIGTYERTDEFDHFNSKFDRVNANIDQFTDSEQRGFDLFSDKKSANCISCHSLEKDNPSAQPIFTNFSYANLGLPVNPEIQTETDIGLERTTGRHEDSGKFKVPTLRNISATGPYMHNGYFKTLKQVVDFLNTRDTKPACSGPVSAEEAEKSNCWPPAEVAETVNHKDMGDLKMSDEDVDDILAFLQTLSDS